MITAASKLAGADYSRYLVVDRMDEENLGRAKENFAYYQQLGVITGGTFDDDIWNVTDEKSRTSIRFNYSDDDYENHAQEWIECSSKCYREAAKAYIVFLMGSRALGALRGMATMFRNAVVEDFSDGLNFGDDGFHMAELLRLIPGDSDIREAAIEKLEDSAAAATKVRGRQRKLLDFSSYFHFSDALNDFWATADDREKLFYFPLYLWWNLTAVLPLRVTEFLVMPRECIQKTAQGYLVTVRRTRLKGGHTLMTYHLDDDYVKKAYPISDKIAGEICWYREKTSQDVPPPIDVLFYMAPYKSYRKDAEQEVFNYDCLVHTRDDFYKYVLVGKGIPVVKPGDTRHIAMMNLIISGGSPRICMELAGHVNMGISSHYYSNMSALVECATYELYRRNKKGTAAVISGSSIYSLERTENLIKIPDGWCCSTKRKEMDVSDCIMAVNTLGEIGDCKCCRHFRPERQGVHLDFLDTELGKEKVTADSWFLMHMVEAVRQGIGCREDLRQAMLRLQQSCSHYSECLLKQYEEEENGQA